LPEASDITSALLGQEINLPLEREESLRIALQPAVCGPDFVLEREVFAGRQGVIQRYLHASEDYIFDAYGAWVVRVQQKDFDEIVSELQSIYDASATCDAVMRSVGPDNCSYSDAGFIDLTTQGSTGLLGIDDVNCDPAEAAEWEIESVLRSFNTGEKMYGATEVVGTLAVSFVKVTDITTANALAIRYYSEFEAMLVVYGFGVGAHVSRGGLDQVEMARIAGSLLDEVALQAFDGLRAEL
jgi:hypothetical protein